MEISGNAHQISEIIDEIEEKHAQTDAQNDAQNDAPSKQNIELLENWRKSTHWGQVIMGPPGAGKTTYCKAMKKVMPELRVNSRQVCWINLDPANDIPPPKSVDDETIRPDIDISDLVCLEDVMENTGLGPNGGLLHCMDIIFNNIEWLTNKLLTKYSKHYLLFDIPGQVELNTQNHSSLKKIVDELSYRKTLDIRLAAVHLVDATYCIDPSKYLSAIMVSLSTMIHMEMPHVNVLSKLDLAEQNDADFDLEFYTDLFDLDRLLDQDNRVMSKRHRRFLERIAEIITDYSLVKFIPMSIQSVESLEKVVQACDVSNGFFSVEGGAATSAMQLPQGYDSEYIREMQEKFGF